MEPAEPFTTCKILHRDSWLLVVEKPAGVLSHPNPGPAPSGRRYRCAFEGSYDPAGRRFEGPAGPVWLIHRLDRATSGVLLAALDAATASRCREAFERGQVEKHYLALLAGLLPAQGVWKNALEERHMGGKVRVWVRRGAPPNAELRFRALDSSPPAGPSLAEVCLLTGRTHQIRVQAASRRHPLLGDDVYGHFGLNRLARRELGLRRLFLHAASLSLPHPGTEQPLTVTSPLPGELAQVLAKLGFAVPPGFAPPS